jgi:hypothetical protein
MVESIVLQILVHLFRELLRPSYRTERDGAGSADAIWANGVCARVRVHFQFGTTEKLPFAVKVWYSSKA